MEHNIFCVGLALYGMTITELYTKNITKQKIVKGRDKSKIKEASFFPRREFAESIISGKK